MEKLALGKPNEYHKHLRSYLLPLVFPVFPLDLPPSPCAATWVSPLSSPLFRLLVSYVSPPPPQPSCIARGKRQFHIQINANLQVTVIPGMCHRPEHPAVVHCGSMAGSCGWSFYHDIMGGRGEQWYKKGQSSDTCTETEQQCIKKPSCNCKDLSAKLHPSVINYGFSHQHSSSHRSLGFFAGWWVYFLLLLFC